jgi:hypothetical protein
LRFCAFLRFGISSIRVVHDACARLFHGTRMLRKPCVEAAVVMN